MRLIYSLVLFILMNQVFASQPSWQILATQSMQVSQVGIERSIGVKSLLSIHYGRFIGQELGYKERNWLKNLHIVGMGFVFFPGAGQGRWERGIRLHVGADAYLWQVKDPNKSIQYKGKRLFSPGDTKVGPVVGLSYHLKLSKKIHASLGAEARSLGDYHSISPAVVRLGLVF
jgi:hypothetical protein